MQIGEEMKTVILLFLILLVVSGCVTECGTSEECWQDAASRCQLARFEQHTIYYSAHGEILGWEGDLCKVRLWGENLNGDMIFEDFCYIGGECEYGEYEVT